jgi:hypothetical protein
MPNSGLAPAVVGGGTRTRSQVAPHCQSAAADRGRSRFSPVGDMGAGSYDCVDARIGAITLDALTIATQNSAVSLRLTFRHSGESIFAAATNAPATGLLLLLRRLREDGHHDRDPWDASQRTPGTRPGPTNPGT